MIGKYLVKSVEETKHLASNFAKQSQSGDVIALIGNLGTGKTTFTQGFADAFGVSEPVGSPTFKLISEYMGTELALFHIDCYRLENVQQFINIGGEEYLEHTNGVTLIEWADIITDILPQNTYYLNINRLAENENHREIRIYKK